MKLKKLATAVAIATGSALLPFSLAAGVQDPTWQLVEVNNGRRYYIHTSEFVDLGDTVQFKAMTAYGVPQEYEDHPYNFRSLTLRANCAQQTYSIDQVTFHLESMIVGRVMFDEAETVSIQGDEPAAAFLGAIC